MERRPLAVVLIAIYHAGFSAFLFGLLLWQIATHQIHATVAEKAVVLPFTFLIAMLPGVLGFGLWMLDNAARLGVILFTLLHAISEIAYLSNAQIPSRAFTVFRIGLDVLMILCLCSPGVRTACKWQSAGLNLHPGGDEEPRRAANYKNLSSVPLCSNGFGFTGAPENPLP
jgi:hypothetical protein